MCFLDGSKSNSFNVLFLSNLSLYSIGYSINTLGILSMFLYYSICQFDTNINLSGKRILFSVFIDESCEVSTKK